MLQTQEPAQCLRVGGCTLHSARYIVHITQFTLQNILQSTKCTEYTAEYTIHSAHCTVHSTLCRVDTAVFGVRLMSAQPPVTTAGCTKEAAVFTVHCEI